MKETKLDKYVGKYVRLLDFVNSEYIGNFYKIENGKFVENGIERTAVFKKGYVLSYSKGFYNLRPQEIIKIDIMEK